jgi:hypothetical protein
MKEKMMDDRSAPGNDSEDKNDDWDRTVSLDEAQQTAGEAEPGDFAGTSATESGLTAGGEGTGVGEDDQGAGGTPYTEGYVTGGAHHPTIADLPPNDETA